MFKELRNNDHGVVFVTVLIIIMVSMIIAVTVLSLNISQIKSSEEEFKHIQSQLEAQGALSRVIINQFGFNPATASDAHFNFSSGNIQIIADIDRSAGGGSSSKPLNIDVTVK